MKLIKRLYLLGAILCSLNVSANTLEMQFKQALQAFEQGNYDIAFQIWMSLAQKGDPASQHNIGLMYGNGVGIKQDETQAIIWTKRAANQGYADSMMNLGWAYTNGRGVKRNVTEAMKWYSRACAKGKKLACQYYQEITTC